MPVEILCDRDIDTGSVDVHARVQAALRALRQRLQDERLDHELCVRLCGADAIQSLNNQYRGKNKPTNVLSFAAEVSVPDIKLLGDIALCWPVLVEEAAAQGKDLADHFTHLTVHGVLHLLGYDHETSRLDAERMEALECELLGELGIANPYR